MDSNTKRRKNNQKKCKDVKEKEQIFAELAYRLGLIGPKRQNALLDPKAIASLNQSEVLAKAINKIDLYQSLLEQKEEHIRTIISEYYSAGEANPSVNLKYKKEKEMKQTIDLLKRDQERLFKENLQLKRENAELKKLNKLE